MLRTEAVARAARLTEAAARAARPPRGTRRLPFFFGCRLLLSRGLRVVAISPKRLAFQRLQYKHLPTHMRGALYVRGALHAPPEQQSSRYKQERSHPSSIPILQSKHWFFQAVHRPEAPGLIARTQWLSPPPRRRATRATGRPCPPRAAGSSRDGSRSPPRADGAHAACGARARCPRC